jgi:hypothetical protein
MSKFIFILFLIFTSINSFGQENITENKTSKSDVLAEKNKIKKEKIEVSIFKGTEIELLLNNNLCEILSIKPSDLLNEKMLKKLRANV